jgi:hypothetical protein
MKVPYADDVSGAWRFRIMKVPYADDVHRILKVPYADDVSGAWRFRKSFSACLPKFSVGQVICTRLYVIYRVIVTPVAAEQRPSTWNAHYPPPQAIPHTGTAIY